MLIVIIKYDCHYCCVSPVAGSILYDFQPLVLQWFCDLFFSDTYTQLLQRSSQGDIVHDRSVGCNPLSDSVNPNSDILVYRYDTNSIHLETITFCTYIYIIIYNYRYYISLAWYLHSYSHKHIPLVNLLPRWPSLQLGPGAVAHVQAALPHRSWVLEPVGDEIMGSA